MAARSINIDGISENANLLFTHVIDPPKDYFKLKMVPDTLQ